MELDWFTLVAQIINFLVLVALLRKLFYRRLIDAMDAREANISGRLEEAAHQRATAEQEAESFRTRNRAFDAQREQMLAQAGEEAEARRQQLLEDARLEAERAQAKWLEALQRERSGLLQDFRARLGQGVFTLASRALAELADTELEDQIVKAFVERVRTLDPAERAKIVTAARGSEQPIEVRTAFPLRAETQEALSRSLRQHLDDTIAVRFTTAPDLICGIELRAHSHHLAWNLDAYLADLETRVFEELEEHGSKHADIR